MARKLLCILLLLTLSQCTHPQTEQKTIASTEQETFLPQSTPLIHREGYVLQYDGRTRHASWVYEKLTSASLEGQADRSECDFMEDPLIPKPLRATKEDYRGSGYDRGHLCPAADQRISPTSMRDTFYLSNISPQHPLLNRKYWLKVEKYVRELAKGFDVVHVITGPLFLPQEGKDGKRYIQYEVIGKSDIAVPTHYFKILYAQKGKKQHTEAFIIPNEPISQDSPLSRFAVTLSAVEKATGLILKK